MNIQEIQKLPKIDLHCHLDGSLSLACVRNLLGRNVKLEELQVAADCKDLTEYLKKFELPLEGLQTSESLKAGAYDFIRDVASENVRYVEVRFAPLLSTNGGLSMEEVIESVLDGLKLGKERFGVESNIIACLMRHQSAEDNLKVIRTARSYLGNGLCAIDLAGDESTYPMSNFVELFNYAKSIGLPFTIHAGEQGSVQNVLEAVNCGAKRIGHGIALTQNQDAQKILIANNIGIEMCPISNQQTKSVSDLSKYPIKEFLNNGLLVTLNTDNRMVSNTSISKEIRFVQTNFDVTDEEIVTMMNNALKVSFATDAQKQHFLNFKKEIIL